MFKWLKRLFHRPRLIERYEDLDAIIEAHNALIRKSLEIMSNTSVPPKYVLSRFNAIQDAEEKAIAAYWHNKNRKQDKWYKRPTMPDIDTIVSTITDILHNNKPSAPTEAQTTETQTTKELATTPTVETKPNEEVAAVPTVEALPPDNSSNAQPLEAPKENVIEIHINK